MSRLLLELDDVGCIRGGRVLFENLNLRVAPGDAAIVIGPNGAGKSSLLRIAAGLLRPSAGSVSVEGSIALLTEAAALDGERRVRDALMFWARLDRRPDPEERVRSALERLDLSALGDAPAGLLSTGQRRRAALARTIATEAPIWLLDEPTNGLDESAVGRLENIIAEHRARGGVALIATHLRLDVADARVLSLAPEDRDQ